MFKKGDILQHKSNKKVYRKVLEIVDYGWIKVYKVLPLNKDGSSWLLEDSDGLSLSVKYINDQYNLYKRIPTKVRRLQ